MPDSRSPQPINPSWERVQLARHPKRPHSLDYIQRLFTDFHELHGDRAFADDHAIVAGMAWFEGFESGLHPVGEVELKGFGRPITAYEVQGLRG